MSDDRSKTWKRNSLRHAEAVQRFVVAAKKLDQEQWILPLGEGKWNPGQVTEHLVQSYHVAHRQITTGEGLKIQTGWVLRQVLRLLVLRPILWTRRLPPGARAAREILPIDVTLEQQSTLVRFEQAVERFVAALETQRIDQRLWLTHHVFGTIEAESGIDFLAIHTEHHARQLEWHQRSSPRSLAPPS